MSPRSREGQKVDRFCFTGSRNIKKARVGTLESIIEEISLLTDCDSLGFDTTRRNSHESKRSRLEQESSFRLTLTNADEIWLGDELIWEASSDVAAMPFSGEWDSETKKKFKSVSEKILFSTEEDSLKLSKVNYRVFRSVTEMLMENYKIDGSKYTMLPSESNGQRAKLIFRRYRNSLEVEYEYEVSVLSQNSCFYEFDSDYKRHQMQSVTYATRNFDDIFLEPEFALYDFKKNVFLELVSADVREEKNGRTKFPVNYDERFHPGNINYALYNRKNEQFYFVDRNGTTVKIKSTFFQTFFIFNLEQGMFEEKPLSCLYTCCKELLEKTHVLYSPGEGKFYSERENTLEEILEPKAQRVLLFGHQERQFIELQGVHPGLVTTIPLEGKYTLFNQDACKFIKISSSGQIDNQRSPLRDNESLEHLLRQESLKMRFEFDCRSLAPINDSLIFRPLLSYRAKTLALIKVGINLDVDASKEINATINLEVKSDQDCPLVYCGPKQLNGVQSIEHFPQHQKNKSRVEVKDINQLIDASQQKKGVYIHALLNSKDNTVELLSHLLSFFQESLLSALLKHRRQSSHVYSDSENNQAFSLDLLLENFFGELSDSEKFQKFLEISKRELEQTFHNLSRKTFILLYELYRDKFIILYESVDKVIEAPGSLASSVGVKSEQLANIAFFTLKAIELTGAALEKSSAEEGLYFSEVFNKNECSPDSDVRNFFKQLFLNNLSEKHFMNNALYAKKFFLAASKIYLQNCESFIGNAHEINIYLSEEPEQSKRFDNEVDICQTEVRLVEVRMPQLRRRLKLANREKIAALLKLNPLLQSLNDLSLRYTILQFMKLAPYAYQNSVSWFFIADIVGGTIGGLSARSSILHPNDPVGLKMRLWRGFTDGLVICRFNLGTAIEWFLDINPKDGTVSDKVFLEEIAPIPVTLGMLSMGWLVMSPSFKDRLFQTNERKIIRLILNVIVKSIYASGVFSFLMRNFTSLPKGLVYQSIPLGLGVAFALPEFTKLELVKSKVGDWFETTDAIISYTAGACFSVLLVEDLIDDYISGDWISFVSRITFWSGVSILSFKFNCEQASAFVNEYNGNPEYVIQRMPLGQEVDPENHPSVPKDVAQIMCKPNADLNPTEKSKLLLYMHNNQGSMNLRDLASGEPNEPSQKYREMSCRIL